MQVFPTAPSPTVTHFMNLDAPLISSAGSKKSPLPCSCFFPQIFDILLTSKKPISRQNRTRQLVNLRSTKKLQRTGQNFKMDEREREREREREIDDFDDD